MNNLSVSYAQKAPRTLGRARGFGLVELMISIVLGMIVMLAIASLNARVLASSNDMAAMTHLDQNLRRSLQLVVRDLRRAGFFNNSGVCAALSRVPTADRGTDWSSLWNGRNCSDEATFNSVTLADAVGGTTDVFRCVLFSYDRNGDNSVGTSSPDERYGYRWNSNASSIEIRQQGEDCNGTNWASLLDTATVEITDLRFIRNFQTVNLTGVGGTITLREIGVEMSGRLKGDPSVTRIVRETVKLRNDNVAAL